MATLTVIDFEKIKKVSEAPLEASHPLGQGSNVWMKAGPPTFSALRTLFWPRQKCVGCGSVPTNG